MESVDCIVIGAGVIGLAVARALALAGREVIVLERADGIGTETSSRNSEVIHAGIYYPAGSFMARFCVAGRRALYAYCRERGVAHMNCGKLIVATSEEEDGKLAGIKARAEANGVEGMRVLTRAEAMAMEPALHCTSALHSPVTGVVDSHAFMLALQGDAENAGAVCVFFSPVTGARVRGGGIEVDVGGAEPMTLRTRLLVNSAGLHAPGVASRIDGMPRERVPTAYYAKGNYFTLLGRSPFSRLIYPVPVPGGLGVHLTIDLGGQARFGPDVEWIEEIDYTVDPARADEVLRRRAPLLARPAGRRDPARLCRDSAEDRPALGRQPGLRHPGPADAWRAGADQSVRDREPGAYRLARSRRFRGGDQPHRVGEGSMPRRIAMTAALALFAGTAGAASAYDGEWNVAPNCSTGPDGALGYTFYFPARISDGVLSGEHGTSGQPAWLSLEGRIAADGTATLFARGLTNRPVYTLGRVGTGTPYQYHVKARFEARQGTGQRVEGRECGYTFTRR